MVWPDMKIWYNAVRLAVTNKLATATSVSTRVMVLQLKKGQFRERLFWNWVIHRKQWERTISKKLNNTLKKKGKIQPSSKKKKKNEHV